MQQMVETVTGVITSLESSEFWLFSLFVLACSGYAFARLIISLKRSRLMSGQATAKIRSASQGCVELNGNTELMPGPPIVSPISGRHCVWFEFIVEQKQTYFDGKRQRTRWVVVQRYRSDGLFYLRDETGVCVVDPEAADVLHAEKRAWSDKLNADRRYREWFLSAGQPLYALGWFISVQTASQQILREQVSLLLREWKQDFQTLLKRYDQNQDGDISEQEWQQAVADANTHVRQQHLSQPMDAIHVLAKGPHRKPYILSALPEKRLLRHYQWQFFLTLAGFLISGSLWIWAMNLRQGW
ncbi:MAG: GIDE domain-containing protein [Methylophaga sp.]|nr:GIDE domain-containing protein [Methylophaga sp.]